MDTQNHFSTEELTVNVEHLPHCEIKFSVHTQPALIAQAKEKAKKQVSKEVSIPGFRKGKAPLDMIEKKFAGSIREKTLQELAEVAFRKAQDLTKIHILNAQTRIDFDLKHFDEILGADMTYKFEIEPKTPTISAEDLSLPEITKEEASNDKINETLSAIRSYFSVLDAVKDRPAKEGDFVILDIEDTDSNPPQKVFNKMRFEVSEKGMSEWMRELIDGMNSGDSKDGVSRPNSTDSEEIKSQYQPKNVRVTLHEIQSATLPEVDENLAKKLGLTTVEQLHEQLKSQLTKRIENDYKEAIREKLCEVILEKYSFDLPKSLIQREYEHRLHMMHQDKNFERSWKKMSYDEQEAFKAKTMKEAENAIRLFYIFRKVMLDHKVKLSLPAKNVHPTNLVEAMFIGNQEVDYENASEDQRAVILSKAMLSSAQDYLLDQIMKKS